MPVSKSIRVAAAAGVGYLLGTIPSADLASRLASGGQVNLRTSGSGNPGGANVANVIGKKWGGVVMVADVAKGLVASRLGQSIASAAGGHAAATGAVVGHCLPAWNGFRGGKGVATSVGQVLGTFPPYFPIDFAVAATAMASHRFEHRAFASTALASAVWVTSAVVWWRKQYPNLWGPEPSMSLPLAAAVSSGVILARFATAHPPEEDEPGQRALSA